MAKQLYTNNSTSTLGSAVTDDATTTITLATGDGALFASPSGGDWQVLTLTDGAAVEIVKMTGRAGDVLTVMRGHEGTTAAVWAIGAAVSARLTAGMLDRLVENTHADGGLAIGAGSTAGDGSAVAVGPNASAAATGGIAIGFNAKAFRPHQLVIPAHACITRDDWNAGGGSQYNAGADAMWASHFAELGVPAPWAASTAYTDGAVVGPTTPDGYQYRLWHGAFDGLASPNTVTSGASEPTWPASMGGDVAVDASGDHYWIGADLSVGMDEVTPAGMVFYPSEAGFVCFNYSGVTDAPFVSIGTVASPTLLVNNQQLSGITGATQRQAFTGFKDGITDLRIKLVTPATGASARFHGRFYIKGFFIQTQG